jgi:hypothetical protein
VTLAALQDFYNHLPDGAFALEVPTTSRLPDLVEVTACAAAVEHDPCPETIAVTASHPGEQIGTGPMKLGAEMEAVLTAPDTDILSAPPSDRVRQPPLSGNPAVWRWSIRPQHAGNHEITVEFYAVLPQKPFKVKTKSARLSVSVAPETIIETITRWFNGLSQLVTALQGLLLATAGVVTLIASWLGYRQFRRRQTRARLTDQGAH